METMNDLMKEKIKAYSGTSIGQNKKILITESVNKLLRQIKYYNGCLLAAPDIDIDLWLTRLTDYTGVEAYFNEFRVQDKLYSEAGFSEVWYFVISFENELRRLYPDLLIETILSEDNLGYYNYRFYQYRKNEGHYLLDINGFDDLIRINRLWSDTAEIT